MVASGLTFSSTPDAARTFYKKDLTNGFFGRIPFAYKGRGERSGRIPRQGTYDEDFLQTLDEYLLRLDNCKGRFHVKPLNKVADQLAEEMARLSDLADDDILFELSHRSIFAAWKKGATLWILNDQTWSRSIGEFVVWFCYYDLWSKVKVFGDLFKSGDILRTRCSGAAPRICSTTCPTPSTRHSSKPCAQVWTRAVRVRSTSSTSGKTAASSPSLPKRDSTPKPPNTSPA